MDINKITTLGALKAAGYQSKNIQEELRSNLIEKLKKAEDTFSGIIGYENTVIPQLHSAILSKHHRAFGNSGLFHRSMLEAYVGRGVSIRPGNSRHTI